MRASISEDAGDDSVDSDGSSDMAAKDTSSQPQTAGRAEDTGEAEVAGPEEASAEEASAEKASPEKASPEKASAEKASPEKASPEKASPEEAGERPGNPPGDVGAILDDLDEALEENAEEIVRSYVQEGGQ
jgi:ubiquitin-like protein Pup